MRQTFTILMVLMFYFMGAKAQNVFYSQMGETAEATYYFSSMKQHGWQGQTLHAADDFEVPAGSSVEITGLAFLASTDDSYGVLWNGVDIEFYADDNGKPGAAIDESLFSQLTYSKEAVTASTFKYTVEFHWPVLLSPGKYWVRFNANVPEYGAWCKLSLLSNTSSILTKAQVKTVDNGMGASIDWKTIDDDSDWNHSNAAGTYNNLVFELHGGTPADNDLQANAIISPTSGETTATQEISINIKNAGLNTQMNFDVAYQVSTTIDNVLTLVGSDTVTYMGSLTSGEEKLYSFTKTVDMSEVTIYNVMAYTILATDEKPDNNDVERIVENFGEVHDITVDREVTTCGGIFIPAPLGEIISEGAEDTITFYPGTEGGRISLDFTAFEYHFYQLTSFIIYDGATTDAPILHANYYAGSRESEFLANLPEYIQARNPEGVLTVTHKTQPSYSGSPSSWRANVNCETPFNINFVALDLKIGEELDVVKHNSPTSIMAVITNAGIDTIARNVHLIEDGITIATKLSNVLIPGVLDTIYFDYVPSFANPEMNVQVRIENDPQETNEDNFLESLVVVFNDVYVESFEYGTNGRLDIDGWISMYGLSKISTSQELHGEQTLQLYSNDTVIMPLTWANENSTVEFESRYNGKTEYIQLLVSENIEGPWTVIDTAEYINSAYTHQTFDIGMYIDSAYYFALTQASGNSYVELLQMPYPYYYNYDLEAIDFTTLERVTANKEITMNISFKNNGLMDINATNYIVNIRDNDSIYATFNGINIASMESASINGSVYFETTDTLELYAEIVMEEELLLNNNRTNKASLIVIGKDSYVYGSGEISSSNSSCLYRYKSGSTKHAFNSIFEAVYYPNETQGKGELNAIEYTYLYNKDGEVDGDTLVLNIYMVETADSFLVDTSTWTKTWVESDSLNFVKVFSGTVHMPNNGKNVESQLLIDLDIPFQITGDKNLIVLVDRDSSYYSYSNYASLSLSTFKHVSNDLYANRFLYGYKRTFPQEDIDPANIIDLDSFNGSKSAPHLNFYFNNTEVANFVSEAVTGVNEFEDYGYDIEITNISGDYEVVVDTLPEWLTLKAVTGTTATLTGTADTVGVFPIQLIATDGYYTSTQTFEIIVSAVPVVVSENSALTLINEEFTGTTEVTYNGTGFVAFTATDVPTWAIFTDNGDNTASIAGTPDATGVFEIAVSAIGETTTDFVYTLTVDAIPTIVSMENVEIKEGTDYSATITLDYAGTNTVTLTAGDTHSSELTITDNEDGTATVTATALAYGTYTIAIVADNGNYTNEMTYEVFAYAVPVITSDEPANTGSTLVEYSYTLTTSYNGTDDLIINADVPAWMTFTDNGDGTATFVGTPDADGIYTISSVVIGDYAMANKAWSINVVTVGINTNEVEFSIYPNPAQNWIKVNTTEISTVEIHDLTGKLLLTQEMNSTSERINTSELNTGIYIISISNNDTTVSQRLVIE